MRTIAIIGAGMAGLSCADKLADAGYSVRLFDKGRGPGGRMSTRRLDSSTGQVSFDHGAQYFTVRDREFSGAVTDWASQGIVAPWPAAGEDAWVGVPSMNGVIRGIASRHNVAFGSLVKGLVRDDAKWSVIGDGFSEGPFDAVVVATPAEQAAAMLSLHDFEMARSALQARSQPCWTAMFAFENPLLFSADILRNSGPINWAARNSAKPGRGGPEAWVVQASPSWSKAHLEEGADRIAEVLKEALQQAVGANLPNVIASAAHRWRYAMTAGTNLGSLWNSEIALGACGDWLLGPRVECAWLSGQDLARKLGASGLEPSDLEVSQLDFLDSPL